MHGLKPFLAFTFALAPTLALAACRAPQPDLSTHTDRGLQHYLDCLPPGASLTAAHRGTQRGSPHPENSIDGLDALLDADILLAEIDVARTRDGQHILFHDGVWDDGSNGRGPVAATDWPTAQTYSLRTTKGRLTDSGVPTLEQYLARARDNIFLEIDFKTSARYSDVLEIIENYDMMGSVILIAYSPTQARRLRALAPDALISIPPDTTIPGPTLTFTGGTVQPIPGPFIAKLRGRDRYAPPNLALAANARINVTDYALEAPPVLGLRDPDDFLACLSAP